MTKYIQRQITEITESRALSGFAIFLVISHMLTWFYWGPARESFVRIASSANPICWSYFPDCASLRPFSELFAQGLLGFYLLLALFSLVVLLLKKFKIFWWALLALTVLKWSMLSLDYRFMGNYHYMSIVACLVYLLISSKKKVLPVLLISFYVAAGLLKFTPEWYSGETLLRPAFIRGKLLEWLLVYVIYLEILFVWGLLAKNKWLRWAAFIQLVLFHAFSWHIVGFFYPLIMFCLISIFPLAWYFNENDWHVLKWSKSAIATVAIFWVAQLVPFAFYSNSALTGEGRILSLNMLDAWTQCDSTTLVKMKNQQLLTSLPTKNLGVRIQCDPAVYVALVKQECKRWQDNPDFIDLDYTLQSKLKTDYSATEIMHLTNACSRPPKLGFLGRVSQ